MRLWVTVVALLAVAGFAASIPLPLDGVLNLPIVIGPGVLIVAIMWILKVSTHTHTHTHTHTLFASSVVTPLPVTWQAEVRARLRLLKFSLMIKQLFSSLSKKILCVVYE